jgi:rare lipoprotein A (peptidoglycan hydrolase)
MAALVLAIATLMCGQSLGDYKHGWASWYASPLRGHRTYNNPWYTRGNNPVNNFAAVNSFRFGDRPYYIEVCAEITQECTIAKVVDHCAGCIGKRLVDLSPIVWGELGVSLKRGVIEVTVRRYYGNQRASFGCSAPRAK